MKKVAGKITLDKLAMMVQSGFAHVDSKIDNVRSEMATKVELQRFKDYVGERFDGMDNRIEELEFKITAYARTADRSFNMFKEKLDELDSRVNRLEDSMVGQ